MAHDPRYRSGPFGGPDAFDPWGDPRFLDPWERRRRAHRVAQQEAQQRRAAEERELAARREQARRRARVPHWRREAEERLRREQEQRMEERRLEEAQRAAEERRAAEREAVLQQEQRQRLEDLRDAGVELEAEVAPPSSPDEPVHDTEAVAEVEALQARRAASADDEIARARARLERDAQATVAREREALITDFIEVVDDLERALASTEARDDELTKGVEMVRDRFLAKLGKHGVERVTVAKGDRFDAEAHEAIAAVPSAADDEGRVVEVLHPAYRIEGRLLRPAQVVVGRR